MWCPWGQEESPLCIQFQHHHLWLDLPDHALYQLLARFHSTHPRPCRPQLTRVNDSARVNSAHLHLLLSTRILGESLRGGPENGEVTLKRPVPAGRPNKSTEVGSIRLKSTQPIKRDQNEPLRRWKVLISTHLAAHSRLATNRVLWLLQAVVLGTTASNPAINSPAIISLRGISQLFPYLHIRLSVVNNSQQPDLRPCCRVYNVGNGVAL